MVKGPADDSAGTHKRDKSCHTPQLKSDVRPRESRLVADRDQRVPWVAGNHVRKCRARSVKCCIEPSKVSVDPRRRKLDFRFGDGQAPT